MRFLIGCLYILFLPFGFLAAYIRRSFLTGWYLHDDLLAYTVEQTENKQEDNT